MDKRKKSVAGPKVSWSQTAWPGGIPWHLTVKFEKFIASQKALNISYTSPQTALAANKAIFKTDQASWGESLSANGMVSRAQLAKNPADGNTSAGIQAQSEISDKLRANQSVLGHMPFTKFIPLSSSAPRTIVFPTQECGAEKMWKDV